MNATRLAERTFEWATDHWPTIALGILSATAIGTFASVSIDGASVWVAMQRSYGVFANVLPPWHGIIARGGIGPTIGLSLMWLIWTAGWMLLPAVVGMIAARAEHRRAIRQSLEGAVRDRLMEHLVAEHTPDEMKQLRQDIAWKERFEATVRSLVSVE